MSYFEISGFGDLEIYKCASVFEIKEITKSQNQKSEILSVEIAVSWGCSHGTAY
jgi:hypothetical protein